MFNTDLPTRAELPTSAQLRRSTRNAAIAAGVILIAVILPAEYGIDPTRIGRLLGLTEMGQIKQQLAAEAADAETQTVTLDAPTQAGQQGAPATQVDPEVLAAQVERAVAAALAARLQDTAVADVAPEVAAAPPSNAPGRSDELVIKLAPGEGAEVKLVMAAGAVATFSWTVDGGVANYDMHADGGGESITYDQGRGVPGQEGTLEAAFEGNHGWFWRNRGEEPVTIILRTEGDYSELKRLV